MVRTRVGQLTLEGSTVAAFGAAILLLALGSSILPEVKSVAGKGKWVATAAFCVLALVLAARSRPVRAITALHWVAALLVGLSVVSAGWSVAPATTLKYAVSTGVMLVTGAAVGFAVAARPGLARKLGYALAAVAVGIAAVGLVLVLVSRSQAVAFGSSSQPTRLRGLEENPNTAPLLLVPAIPFIVLFALELRSRAKRAGVAVALAIVYGTLFASASRGGWAAGIAVSLALAALLPQGLPRKSAALVAAVVVWAVGIGVQHATIARAGTPPAARALAASGEKSWLEGYPVQGGYLGQLGEELSPGGSTAWSIFGSSGRTGAWRGTIRQALGRPLLGFGFGTEQIVFFDRYYNFQGARVESSYVGMLLQLGFAGLALLAAAVVVLAAAAVRGLRSLRGTERQTLAACAVASLGGVLLGIGQSYLYSAGNIAALSFWVVAFALAGAGLGRARV